VIYFYNIFANFFAYTFARNYVYSGFTRFIEIARWLYAILRISKVNSVYVNNGARVVIFLKNIWIHQAIRSFRDATTPRYKSREAGFFTRSINDRSVCLLSTVRAYQPRFVYYIEFIWYTQHGTYYRTRCYCMSFIVKTMT